MSQDDQALATFARAVDVYQQAGRALFDAYSACARKTFPGDADRLIHEFWAKLNPTISDPNLLAQLRAQHETGR